MNIYIYCSLFMITLVAQSQDFPDLLFSQNCVELDLGPSVQSENKNLLYRWDYGDGGTGYGIVSEHCYDKIGVYAAVLTVTDPYSATDFVNEYQVDVHIVPDVILDISTATGVLVGQLSYQKEIISDVFYYWDIDGQYYAGDSIAVVNWETARVLTKFNYSNEVMYMSKTVKNEN